MIWVFVFGGIALSGLITLIAYAVWLWHKISDLFSEVGMLGQRAEELGELLSQLQPLEPPPNPVDPKSIVSS